MMTLVIFSIVLGRTGEESRGAFMPIVSFWRETAKRLCVKQSDAVLTHKKYYQCYTIHFPG